MEPANGTQAPATRIRALVVLSGGQDSTTCLAWALAQGFDIYAVTFNYGQRHARELEAAKQVAQLAGLLGERHEVVDIGPILKSTSPLVSSEELETYKDYASMDAIIGDRVEKTFVPMRNALFLTLAANRAIAIGASVLVTGVCQADNANYPDCRQTFIHAQEEAINEALGLDRGDTRFLHIATPLMDLSKAQSIQLLDKIGFLPWLAYTHTAYDGQYPPLGQDHASVLRAHGFEDAGLPDPLLLRANAEGLCELPETLNYTDAVYNDKMRQRIAAWGAKLLPEQDTSLDTSEGCANV